MKKPSLYSRFKNYFYLISIFISGLTSIISPNVLFGQCDSLYIRNTIYIQGNKFVKNDSFYYFGSSYKKLAKEFESNPNAYFYFHNSWSNKKWSRISSLLAVGALALSTSKNETVKKVSGISLIPLLYLSFHLSNEAKINLNKSVWLRNKDVLK